YQPVAIRVGRFAVAVTGILLIGLVWGVQPWSVSATDTMLGTIVRVLVDVMVAYLIGDLIWTATKTAIDRRMAGMPKLEHGTAPGPEARMATLLPLIKKTVLVTVIIMVALIGLSSMGVNIAPLLAGAGVVGLAIGFGAQALVRDIVSGVFFLIDDAFRVGEYIEMGDLRGTVESISIRSLRVRHHRGAIHTIPFGELKSLTNYSRDWVIMKLQFRVPFDTDLKLAKKIVKNINAELAANPDYGHHFLEPLKFQGVRRMEEFNMVVGVKFMTKPGEQWTIRRDAYQRIRDEFEKAGIHFAQRNVKVEVIGADEMTDEIKEQATAAAQDAIEQQAAVPAT
ncbi:MAG: mechanosensitive ion channel family protein, partial [Pseudomonadota bacterium]